MKHYLLAFGFAVVPLLSHASINEEWGRASNPTIRSKTFEYNFTKLPLNGSITPTHRLWSGDYWATKDGLINRRWNSPGQPGFRLVSPSKEEAMKMTTEELSQLSPTEKYSLLTGDYDYALVKEVGKHAYRGAPEWYGICHGWAPASINHNEPMPKTVMSKDGIKVPFGSSDIKALLSWYYAYHYDEGSTHQMGKRCFYPYLNPGCSSNDLNAGAFHVVLTNAIALRNESMVVDIEKTELVWNQPVHDYKTTIVKDNLQPAGDSAPGTVKRIRVKTAMGFVQENKENAWMPYFLTTGRKVEYKIYDYMLDIDRAGNIIGGEWNGKSRPDFLWSMERTTSFDAPFESLSLLTDDDK